jgi:hypothetical protein
MLRAAGLTATDVIDVIDVIEHHEDGSEIERDACVFATECLMPALLAGPMCQVAPVSFNPVRASAFATSLQASAMRFVELTPERCAVVCMQRGRVLVLWAKKSPGLQHGSRTAAPWPQTRRRPTTSTMTEQRD